jgi:hypothetical protein
MKRLGLVVLAVAVLAGMAAGQEGTFKRFSFGLGYGSHTLEGLPYTPQIHGTGSHNHSYTPVGGSTTTDPTIPIYQDFGGFSNYFLAVPSFPFVATYRLNEFFGLRASVALLKGSQSDKSNYRTTWTRHDTTIYGPQDTLFNNDVTTTANTYNTKEDISGFPVEFEALPTVHFGDRVTLTPSAGVGYYNYTIKGASSTYDQNATWNVNRTRVTYPGGTRTVTVTQGTDITDDAVSGKLPDMKYTGFGAFFGIGADVRVWKWASIWAQWRKGGIPLTAKFTDPYTTHIYGSHNYYTYTNDIKNSVHARQEFFAIGAAYEF